MVLALDRASQDITELRKLAQEAPEVTRAIVQAASEEVTRSLPELRTTMTEARALVSDADGLTSATAERVERIQRSLVEAERTADRMEQLSRSLNTTIESANRLAARLGLGEPPTVAKSGSRPFDIREYEATAKALESAVVELNTLLERSEAALTSPALQNVETRARAAASDSITLFEQAVHRAIVKIFIGALIVVLVLLGGQWLIARRRNPRP
jgi:hypothetical protein